MINNYIYNPLLKLNLQQVDGGGDDGANKITKFFSASETLTDNEIAQYQGEPDPANNLQPGLFYKKLQGWTKQTKGTQTTITSTYYLNVTDYQDNITTYYNLGHKNNLNCSYYIYHCSNNVDVFMFSESLLNTDLQTFQYGSTYKVYPFARVNGVWDLSNPIEINNNKIYYNGTRLTINNSNGGTLGGTLLSDLNKENLFLYGDNGLLYSVDSDKNVKLLEPVIKSYVKTTTNTSITSIQITINDYTFVFAGNGFVAVTVQTVDSELNANSQNAVSNAAVLNALSLKKITGTKEMSVSAESNAESKYSLYYNDFFAILIFSVTGSSQPPQAITETFNIAIAEEFIFYVNYNKFTSVQCEVKKNNNGFYINMPEGVSECTGYVVIPLL